MEIGLRELSYEKVAQRAPCLIGSGAEKLQKNHKTCSVYRGLGMSGQGIVGVEVLLQRSENIAAALMRCPRAHATT